MYRQSIEELDGGKLCCNNRFEDSKESEHHHLTLNYEDVSSNRLDTQKKKNWSDMQDDISRLIVSKLRFSPHHQKFASACTDWCRITREVCDPFQENYPLLLFPCRFDSYLFDSYESQTWTLYNVFKFEKFEFELPELKHKFVYGASNGWIAFLDDDMHFNLINPINRMQIQLPKSYRDPKKITNLEYFPLSTDPHLRFSKIIISQDRKMVAAKICSRLVVCRPGDDSWTLIGSSVKYLHDFVFFEENLYAVYLDEVIIVDCRGVNEFKTRSIKKPTQPSFQLLQLSVYLVECSGNLLFVSRMGRLRLSWNESEETIFEVYKLDEGTEKWSRMYGLGDKSLFVGRYGSISAYAQENIVGCRPNCIYFSNYNYRFEEFNCNCDNGVFCFDDDSVEMFHISHPSEPCRRNTAIWFQQKR